MSTKTEITTMLTTVETAIADLLTGTAVVNVSTNGKNIGYTRSDLATLREWRIELQNEYAELDGQTRRVARLKRS